MTDEESREVQRYLIRQGFASSLLKPVDADMFYDALRRVLQPKEEGQKKAKELTATP